MFLSRLLLADMPSLLLACSDEPEPTSVLIIDRESLDFGEVDAGWSSAEHLFTMRNASPAAVQPVSMVLEGSGFSIIDST
ncbi:hypothetical protein [Myxococcus sp. Y35]|uniref:hypothetical protein n=1 Tax=Pseudomyxococcus flavus TaxID=3115648 RepID=UPI003CFA940B